MNTKNATSGAGTGYPSEIHEFTPIFSGVRVTRSLVLCVFCRSLFVLFWPLCCLFFFDLRILITPLVSSNSSYPIGSSWSWLYGNWIYNYMRNPCLSPLTWVRIPLMAYDRSEVFSGFLTNITEILLKVALCTITLIKTLITPWRKIHVHTRKVFLENQCCLCV
jgi:hypothetical protein